MNDRGTPTCWGTPGDSSSPSPTRRCEKCGCERPAHEWQFKSGKPVHTAWCRDCRIRFRKIRYRDDGGLRRRARTYPTESRRRLASRALVRRYKAERGCVVCGFKDSPSALDLHHLDPATKLFTLSQYSPQHGDLDALHAELAKCVVLCANHHRMLHAGELRLDPSSEPIVPTAPAAPTTPTAPD